MNIELTFEDLIELEQDANEFQEDEKDIALQLIHLAKLGYENAMIETDLTESNTPPEDCF